MVLNSFRKNMPQISSDTVRHFFIFFLLDTVNGDKFKQRLYKGLPTAQF